MKTSFFFVCVLCALLFSAASCQLPAMHPEVDVSIENRSSQDIENVRARFGDFACSWGNVGRTFKAIYGQYPHLITVETELHWDAGGAHRVQKLDLRGIYPTGKAGRLSFTVHDGRVEVTFREKNK